MEKRNIYVASSWRNDYQSSVVEMLRALGHSVYDFKTHLVRPGLGGNKLIPIGSNGRFRNTRNRYCIL